MYLYAGDTWLHKEFDDEYLVISVQEEGKQVTSTYQQIQVPTKHKLDDPKLPSTQSAVQSKMQSHLQQKQSMHQCGKKCCSVLIH